MPKASAATMYIFQGVWTNWNKGSTFGLTLTLKPDDAALLSPAITLLIAITGPPLWLLFRFALHQLQATDNGRNYLYFQIQVALRNTSTGLGFLWRLACMVLAWRGKDNSRACRRVTPAALLASTYVVIVFGAALWVPRLLNAGNEVLSRSPWCGWYDQDYVDAIYSQDIRSDDVVRMAMEYENNIQSIYASILQHVDICATSVDGCNTLPVKELTFTHSDSVGDCPFDYSVCHPNMGASIRFDTGILSSNKALGFNAPRQDRVSFRLTAQCAPLDDAKFVSGWKYVAATSETPPYQISDADYGLSDTSERNVTFSVTRKLLQCEERMVVPPYVLKANFAPPGGSISEGTSTFNPMPELRLPYADTHLLMLTFNGAYEGPVTDPWFASSIDDDTDVFCQISNRTLYTRDLPITTIGCTQQFEVCNADADASMKSTSCSSPLSLSQLYDFMANPNITALFNDRQRATVDRILNAANGASFFYVVDGLSQSTVAPLQARHQIYNTRSLALPSDQWRIETTYWFSILLAYLQQISLQISTGQFAASTEYIKVTQPSATDALQHAAYDVCRSQIIISQKYRSFNLFGLILTLVLCIFFMTLGPFIEDIVRLICMWRNVNKDIGTRLQMWIINHDLEMLRLISEKTKGFGWSIDKYGGIPVTDAANVVVVHDLGKPLAPDTKTKKRRRPIGGGVFGRLKERQRRAREREEEREKQRRQRDVYVHIDQEQDAVIHGAVPTSDLVSNAGGRAGEVQNSGHVRWREV